MKKEEIQNIWISKDVMIEVDKDGFCIWKMKPIRKRTLKVNPNYWEYKGVKYAKEFWIIDGSLFNSTRRIEIYDKAEFNFGKEFVIKVIK